jgi:hypothetical protein
MAIKNRGETVSYQDTVNLRATFKDGTGTLTDLDLLPQISLISPTGQVVLSPTSLGILRESAGKYLYQFTIPYSPYGVWNDVWVGYMAGTRIEAEFSFVVVGTNTPSLNNDGYIALGDDPGFNYSQNALKNINNLLKGLKMRLNSSGKVQSKDPYGNTVWIDCEIYSTEMLTTFLGMSLSDFNQVPYFTFFTFEDTQIISMFFDVLVEGATYYGLASMSLLERGKEWNIQDNGVSFTPPTMSELMATQFGAIYTQHLEKLKYIKSSMRPSALGLGTFGMNSVSPQLAKLRHVRARQII